MTDDLLTNEFSRVFNLELTQKAGTKVEYVANDQERDALAKRFSIPSVSELKADCEFRKLSQKDVGHYKLSMHLKAKVVQECVLTLNEISESIEETFLIIFQMDKKSEKDDELPKEIEFEAHEEDIELIYDKEVDAGEYIAEYLSLSMNPYPRQENVASDELGYKIFKEEDVIEEPEKKNPFSVLKDLKHKT